MKELIISSTISALLVLLEAVGLFISKRYVIKKSSSKQAFAESAIAAEGIDYSQVEEKDKTKHLEKVIKCAHERVLRENLANSLKEVIPGPELCFLALTLEVCLFLGFNYSTDDVRVAISPYLSTTPDALPIIFGMFIFTLTAWLLTSTWREAIAADLQVKWVRVSLLTIVFVGAGTLASCIYLILMGRV